MKYKSNSSLDSISELSESEISYLSSGNLCNQHQLTDGIPLDCICTDKTKCTSSTQTCAKLWDSVIKKRLSHSIDFMREISCRSLMNAPYLSPGKLNNGMPSSCLLRKYQSPNKLYRIRKRLQSKENIKSNRFVNRNDTEHTHRNLKLYTKPNTYTYLSNYGNVLSDSDESLSFEGMKHLVPISTIPSPYIPCDEETYLLNIQSNAKQNDGQLGRNIPRVKSEELLIIQCDKLAENLSVNCMCNRSELPNSLGVSQHGNFISLNENLKTNCHRGSKKLDGGSNFSKNGKTQPSLYVGEKDRNCSKILQKYQLKPVKNTSTKKTPLTKSPTDALERSELTNVHTYNAYVKCKSSNGLKKKEKIGVKKCSASKNLIHPSSTPSHHRQHHHYHSLACQPKPSNSTYSHPADKQKQRRDVEKKSSNTRSVNKRDSRSPNRHGQLSSHEHRVSLSRDKKRHHSLPPGKQKRHNTAFLTKKQILDASKHVSPDVYVMLGAENRYSLISHYIRHSQEHLSPDLPAVSSALVPVINRNYPTTTTTNSLHHNLNKPVKLKQGCVQYSLEQQTNIDSFDNDDISILTILPIIVVKYSLQTFMFQPAENIQILNNTVDLNQFYSRCMPVIPFIRKRLTTSVDRLLPSHYKQLIRSLVYYSPVNYHLRDNWIGDKNALHCNFSELFQSNLIWMMIRCEKVINQSHVYQLITSMCLNNSLIMQIPLECLDHYKIFSNIEKLDSDTPLKGIKKNEGDNAPLRPPSTMTNTPLTTKTAFEQHSCGLSSSSSTSCNRVHTLCHKHPVSFCKKIANFLFCYCGNFSSGSSVSYTHYNSDLSLYDSSNDFINNSKSDFIYLLVNE
uniref:Uncharacterized protein n=1 Tax=Trichobilharzia regenti TaxID=157069 RepID=A0AA85IYC0_TRIRE|nr:unnamed protein product [Trichobilharzia regenti]